MPELSRFYGIIIAMFYNDHAPPHFHARYNDRESIFAIDDARHLEGDLPARVRGLVVEWATLHREQLRLAWELAREHKPLPNIEPLE
jgi:hypothetical protein